MIVLIVLILGPPPQTGLPSVAPSATTMLRENSSLWRLSDYLRVFSPNSFRIPDNLKYASLSFNPFLLGTLLRFADPKCTPA